MDKAEQPVYVGISAVGEAIGISTAYKIKEWLARFNILPDATFQTLGKRRVNIFLKSRLPSLRQIKSEQEKAIIPKPQPLPPPPPPKPGPPPEQYDPESDDGIHDHEFHRCVSRVAGFEGDEIEARIIQGIANVSARQQQRHPRRKGSKRK